MSKMLCTFSGQYGDILWSLATAQELYRRRRNKYVENPELHNNDDVNVDFGIMPQYRSLVPLIQAQPYVGSAFVLEDWITTGSPFGCQPWNPPKVPPGYDEVRHLTYRFHPQEECLAD